MSTITNDNLCIDCAGNTEFEFKTDSGKGEYFYYRCIKCKLTQVQPRPSLKKLSKLYSIDHSFANGWPNSRCIKNYKKEALRLWKLTGKPLEINVLDVGCNNGAWIKTFRETLSNYALIKTIGIDISEPAIEFCKKNDPKQLYFVKTIEKFYTHCSKNSNRLLPKSYHIIMCGDVIEHIQKPMKFIDAVYNLLIENGVVIIKTPNYGSIGRKLVSSKRWYYSDPPFHLQLFTLKNLCQKLKFHQFNILRTQTSMSSVNIKRAFTRKRSIIRLRPLDNEIQEDGSIKESKITWKQKIVYFVFDSINLLTKPFKIGGSMIIYAKKRT